MKYFFKTLFEIYNSVADAKYISDKINMGTYVEYYDLFLFD